MLVGDAQRIPKVTKRSLIILYQRQSLPKTFAILGSNHKMTFSCQGVREECQRQVGQPRKRTGGDWSKITCNTEDFECFVFTSLCRPFRLHKSFDAFAQDQGVTLTSVSATDMLVASFLVFTPTSPGTQCDLSWSLEVRTSSILAWELFAGKG